MLYIQVQKYDQDMWNRHRESEKHEIGSGTKLLFTFLSWRFFDMKRERHNFLLCWLFHLTPPRATPRCKILVWHRRAPENQLPFSSVESQLLFFFSNPQILSPSLPGHDVIHIPSPIFSLGFFYCDICDCHTCTQYVHLTNPCTKPKGSQPN